MTLDVASLHGADLIDQDGSKIGSIGQVYLDDRTNEPTFATVKTGLFGTKETFVPLGAARSGADGVQVPYTKDYVKDAPSIDAEGHLEENQQDEIYRYYQLDGSATGQGAGGAPGHSDEAGLAAGDRRDGDADRNATVGTDGTADAAGTPGAVGTPGDSAALGADDRAREGAVGDDAAGRGQTAGTAAPGAADDRSGVAGQATREGAGDDASVTLRGEELKVGKERVQTGQARLRKYVVTEHQTITVPVEREEVEVIREPIEGHHVTDGELGEEEVSVTLSEERAVVEKEVVDRERVGLRTTTVTGEQAVEADVRHEEVDVDQQPSDAEGRRDGDTPRTT
ncbi:DUF2382 domain-containing protein [Demetria terragena]|uniref:DUF2382 domain-containing protein n=1 Tax=Demetria terragena TaxID=63959 RepID=UPI0003602E5A|nr:PRC and DUF2382 domain-containing protein [Demetria terragena]